MVLYASKLHKPEKGCLLLNNWAQQAVLLTSYSLEAGAEGVVLQTSTSSYSSDKSGGSNGKEGRGEKISWAPLTLDYEVSQKLWQPIAVNEQYFEALSLLSSFPKGAWELALLLLLDESAKKEEELDTQVAQALFDTGLCPPQGLIAYLRIIGQLQQRTAQWEDVPPHRKITERSILKQ